jgi:putative flippase GtrA
MLPPSLTRKARRFAFSGLLVTGLHVLVAAGIIRFVLPAPPIANGVAFTVATAFSYMINTLWSFSSRPHGRNLLRFVLVSLIGCFLAVTVSGAAQYYGMSYWHGIGLVACTVPLVTFLLHTFWTYR